MFANAVRRFASAAASSAGAAPWKLGKLNHVAIAVPSLQKSVELYRDVLKANVSEPQVSKCAHTSGESCLLSRCTQPQLHDK